MEGGVSNQVIASPTFHVPANINIALTVPVKFYSVKAFGINARAELKCRISGNEVINRTGAKVEGVFATNTSENYTGTGNGILTTSNKTIEVENAYTMTSAYIYVYSVTANYR